MIIKIKNSSLWDIQFCKYVKLYVFDFTLIICLNIQGQI